MNFTLHQLQIFVEVVNQGNISRAAQSMHLTQPAVSIQLKNFQQQFDTPLIEILHNRLYITDLGREVADIAKEILNEAESIQLKTKLSEGVVAGKLRISTASTGKYVAPYFLEEFLNINPGVDLVLDVTNKTQVVSSLKKNEIDFAMVSVLPQDLEVEEEQILENRLYLVGKDNTNPQEARFIFREKGSATRVAMDKHFQSSKRDRKRLELTSNEAVKQAVIAGLGHSILPLIGLKNSLSTGEVRILPTKGLPIYTMWRLIWLPKKTLSPVASAFLEHLRERKEDIIKDKFSWYLNFDPEKHL